MNFNDKEYDIDINAYFIIRKNSRDTYIEVTSKDGKSINLVFNYDEFDPKKLEINKVIDIKKNIYWDVDFETSGIKYVFDITKDIVNLTRLDDNLFKLEVKVENPDMIFSTPRDEKFKNLIISKNFSFTYE